MDSGAEATGDWGEPFDEMPLKKPRLNVWSELPPPASLWVDIHPDILGVVLRFLPCLADRASVRSVCPRWRTAASNQALPPPLPLLVLPKFSLSCLTSDKELTAARSPLMPEEVAADSARYVGSCDRWLVGVIPTEFSIQCFRHCDGDLVKNGYRTLMYDGCFLVNAFSRRVIRLPHLFCTSYICGHLSSKVLPIANGLGDVRFEINGPYKISPNKVVLSASPDSGSKYIVAASSVIGGSTNLALWQPGMMSWHVCSGLDIDGLKDITFYQGKLYMFQMFTKRLFAFVLDEDDRGIVVSRVEQCVTEPLPPNPMEQDGPLNCDLVVWRENLLLITRYYNGVFDANHKVIKVKVFAVDFSINPYGLTEIHSLDGDCIFIGSGSSKSFPASLHDGVEGDLIYFVPDHWSRCDRFVYNMRDGRMMPFSAKSFVDKDNHLPVWLFPSE